MALKRDLAGWLDAKLTEIERRHSLDEKNSALLRAMAVKRFSKYSRATAGVSHTNFNLQGWAKEWSLGCVNSRPAAKGS